MLSMKATKTNNYEYLFLQTKMQDILEQAQPVFGGPWADNGEEWTIVRIPAPKYGESGNLPTGV